MRTYDTPNAPAGDPLVCRSFALRPGLWRALFDHLNKLQFSSEWTQLSGMSVEQATQEIRDAIDAGVFQGCIMIGQVMWITGPVPTWCLLCDGSVYLKGDHPELWAAMDDNYSVSLDTFRVPNLINRFAMGSATPGDQGGEATHTLTTDEMPSHNHAAAQQAVALSAVCGVIECEAIYPEDTVTGDTGGGQPHNNLPPYETITPVIVEGYPSA